MCTYIGLQTVLFGIVKETRGVLLGELFRILIFSRAKQARQTGHYRAPQRFCALHMVVTLFLEG